MSLTNQGSDAMSQPSTAAKPSVDSTNERLKSFVERIERLESEKKEIADDIKDVYLESKATGFEPKIIREAITSGVPRAANVYADETIKELLKLGWQRKPEGVTP